MTLPNGWRSATLGDVARWGSGGTPKAGTSDYYGGDIPWAVIGDLSDGLVGATANHITTAGLAASSAKRVPAGAVLVAMYGSIGKLGLTTSELTTNQAIAFAVPDPEVVEARFLFYYLLGQREALSAAGKGATQRNIGQGTLKPWHIPLPPLLEQRRIVEILEDHLSRLDAAEELLARSRDRLRPLGLLELQQSMDQSGALDVPLSAFVERVEAGRSFGGSAPSARADEWGIVKVSAMTWGAFRPSENKAVPTVAVDPRFEIKPGDLLVSRANTTAYVGAAVLVSETRPKLLLSDKSLRIVARSGIDPRWLLAALTSPRVRTQISALATGTKDSMRNISQANLLGVRLPDEGADGRSRVVQDHERTADRGARLAAELKVTTAKAKSLRRSLLAAAFSGQLTSTVTTDKIEEMAGV